MITNTGQTLRLFERRRVPGANRRRLQVQGGADPSPGARDPVSSVRQQGPRRRASFGRKIKPFQTTKARQAPAFGRRPPWPSISRSTGRAARSRPSPTRRCSTCCATISSSTAPSSAAGWRNAAPARCWSTARRCAPASRRSARSARARSPRIEGLGTIDKPHALQRAFIEEQAAQCGYCINGMIMSAKELLDRNPRPSEADVRAALAGNLCRCGTHNRIVRAVLRAAQANGRT